MKTGEVAKILGVDVVTIRRWIDHDLLNRFFSTGAKGENNTTQRILSESDLLALNTILVLRSRDNADWQQIADYLDTGKREQSFPQNAIAADPRTIPLPQAEQSARAMATLAERDAALARVDELADELESARQRIMELEKERELVKESLLREMMDLRQRIGRLEGLLEAEKSHRNDSH